MNILYIGYWSVNDGLSEASIKPVLEVLSGFDFVKKIMFVSIERQEEQVSFHWKINKVQHHPFYSSPKFFMRDKIEDFTRIPRELGMLCQDHDIEKIICRSSLAGAIGYLVHKRAGIDFIVESFEPHAEYMKKSGVWTFLDIRYWIQRYFEKKQKVSAFHLVTVSENYRNHLLKQEKVTQPISVIPCSVNHEEFKFDAAKRQHIRKNLNLSEDMTVGIYVGKFGGIYYDKPAFKFFKACANHISNFFLLILSPDAKEQIGASLKQVNFPSARYFVDKVHHQLIPDYLSAADFAFCLHRSHKFSRAFSPIKNGEYWANGLPIVISNDIGDDSDIMKEEGGGLIVDYNIKPRLSFFDHLKLIIKNSHQNRLINPSVNNAQAYRSKESIEQVYNNILSLNN